MDSKYLVSEPSPGFRVVCYETERFKTGRLSVGFVLPLGEQASAYAVLPYLLSKTCAAYPTMVKLNQKLADLYGALLTPSVSKFGENQVLRLSMTFLDNRFAFSKEDLLLESAKLLCQVIFLPHLSASGCFLAEDVEREKRLMQERLEEEYNDKKAYALRRTEEIMCENEAYAINPWGTPEGVAALTPETVTEAWKTMLSTARIQLNIVGNGDQSNVVSAFQRAMSGVKRAASLTPLRAGLQPEVEKEKHVTETQAVEQGKLVLGFRTGMKDTEKDFPAFAVMTDLLGGGPYSRLFRQVREKESLCYYCSARLYSRKGILAVQSGVETENAQKTEKAVLAQLREMQEGGVTEEDLQNSKRSLLDRYHSVSDTPEEIEGWAHMQICDPRFKTAEEVADSLLSVTREDVLAAARTVKLDTVFLLKEKEELPCCTK